MNIRKIIASATAALLLVGGLSLATAAPASAHTSKVTGIASCETDGTYTVTWTYNATNVPNGVEAETKAMTTNQGTLAPIDGVNKGGQVFLSVWSDHQINVPGAPVKTGNWSAQFKTTGIPGTFKGDVTTMVQTDWRNGPSEDPVGKVYVDGSCKPPVVVPEQPAPIVSIVPVDTLDCKTRTVTTTTTTTTTGWVLVDNVWVQDTPVVTSATTTREATAQECPVIPPPVTNQCVPQAGTHSTNLDDLWANVDTRSAGHVEYVEDGLHVWTDDNSSQAKVSEGIAVNFALKNTGVLDLAWTGSTPPPGINLFVNFGADGNGTLVYESVYGQDLWLTNGSSAAVKANAPVNGGGNGSQWHGTINQWLEKYPDAQVFGLAYSLGSGVKGDGVISSITAGCATHTFDFEEEPVIVPEQPEPVVTVVTEEDVDCEAKTVTVTTTTTTSNRTEYDAETNTWVAIDDLVEVTTATREATVEECPVVEPPVVEPPVVKPPVVVPPVVTPPTTIDEPLGQGGDEPVLLAETGGDPALGVWSLSLGALGVAALVGGIVLLVARRRSLANAATSNTDSE